MPVLAWRKKWVGGAEDQHGFSAAGESDWTRERMNRLVRNLLQRIETYRAT